MEVRRCTASRRGEFGQLVGPVTWSAPQVVRAAAVMALAPSRRYGKLTHRQSPQISSATGEEGRGMARSQIGRSGTGPSYDLSHGIQVEAGVTPCGPGSS